MEQTKALNALEQYLAVTKFATAPRAAADLVTQATSNPNAFVFAELLQTPEIQALSQSAEYAPYLQLLQIFSYGTFAEYLSASSSSSSPSSSSSSRLPALNDAQALKLRQLSLLTLARDPRNLSYASLQQALGLADARAVEDLVVSAVYADLLSAQLDPRRQTVHVSAVSPLRDLAPDSVPAVLGALRAWSGRCADTLADLEAQVAAIRDAAARRQEETRAWEETQARLVEEFRNSGGGGGGGNNGNGSGNNGEERSGGGGGGGGGGVHTRSQGRLLETAISRLRGAQQQQQQHDRQRSIKRPSGSLEAGHDEDEAMDVDEEEPDDGEGGSSARGGALGAGKQRASRRKL
ncbi:Cu(2+)-transporting P-type ATPase [Hypoxylon texense]